MENLKILKGLDLLNELTDEEIINVGKLALTKEYESGESVVKAGDEGDALYIIKSGTVRVSKVDFNGDDELLALLGEGEHFGEFSILDREIRSADITANESCSLIEINADEIKRLLSDDCKIAAKIYKAFAVTLSNRLRESNENLLLVRHYK